MRSNRYFYRIDRTIPILTLFPYRTVFLGSRLFTAFHCIIRIKFQIILDPVIPPVWQRESALYPIAIALYAVSFTDLKPCQPVFWTVVYPVSTILFSRISFADSLGERSHLPIGRLCFISTINLTLWSLKKTVHIQHCLLNIPNITKKRHTCLA